MAKVIKLGAKYRGFELGYVEREDGVYAVWRSAMERKWIRAMSGCEHPQQLKLYACRCIDLQYSFEAQELLLGRALTSAECRQLLKEATT